MKGTTYTPMYKSSGFVGEQDTAPTLPYARCRCSGLVFSNYQSRMYNYTVALLGIVARPSGGRAGAFTFSAI